MTTDGTDTRTTKMKTNATRLAVALAALMALGGNGGRIS